MAALIAWKNLADQAVLSVETGTVDTNFPLSNAQVRGLAAEVYSVPGSPGPPLRLIADMTATPFDWLDQGFDAAVDGFVWAIAVQPDGKILIGGQFYIVNGVVRSNLARLHPDGTLDTSFNPDANNVIYDIAIQPDGKIVLAGAFTSIGGVTRNRVARLHADGALDATFNPNANAAVHAVAVRSNDYIVIGGAFTTIGGVTRNRVARLGGDGTLITSFNPNVNNTVFSIAVQPNNQILIGGEFTQVGGVTRNRVARLFSTGALDTTFNSVVNNTVFSIAVQPDNQILIGGEFTQVGGVTRNRIARVGTTGVLDNTFNPGANDIVSVVMHHPNGLICVGGQFTEVSGEFVRRFAMIRSDGTLDARVQPTLNHNVSALALTSDDSVMVGGYFSSPASKIMRLRSESPDQVRLVAVLGMWEHYSGAAVISYRATAGGAWTEMGRANGAALRSNGAYLPGHMIVLLHQPVSASGQIRVEFPDSDTTPVRFGRLWIGDALVLPDGIDAGWSMGFRDSGSLGATDGQQWVQSPGVITRVLTIPLEGYRQTSVVWGFDDGAGSITQRMSLHALQMEAGITGEVIAVARTGTELWARHSAVYGHIDSPWAIGHTAGPYWGGSLTVVEER